MTSEAYCSISRSRRSLRRSTMISPTSRRSRASAIVDAERLQRDHRVARRFHRRGDDRGFPSGAARRQGDEHQGMGRRHSECRVQQRRTGKDVDATLAAGKQGQLGAVEERRHVEVVGRLRDRARRDPRRCATRGGPARPRGSMAAVSAASRTPARSAAPTSAPVAARSTCSRISARRSESSRVVMRSSASDEQQRRSAEHDDGLERPRSLPGG